MNANCDYTYRKHPSVGYFRVSAALRSSLCIREGADLNTICGDNFVAADIEESGRLRPGAEASLFPQTLDHIP